MASDSTIRLRQLNQAEISGFIAQICSGLLANSGTFVAATGKLTGSFYPRTGNPSNFAPSGLFTDQTDLNSAIAQENIFISQNYYPLLNPSGFGATAYAVYQTGNQNVSGTKTFINVAQLRSGIQGGLDGGGRLQWYISQGGTIYLGTSGFNNFSWIDNSGFRGGQSDNVWRWSIDNTSGTAMFTGDVNVGNNLRIYSSLKFPNSAYYTNALTPTTLQFLSSSGIATMNLEASGVNFPGSYLNFQGNQVATQTWVLANFATGSGGSGFNGTGVVNLTGDQNITGKKLFQQAIYVDQIANTGLTGNPIYLAPIQVVGKTLNDASGITCVNWGGRTLNDSVGSPIIDWENGAISLSYVSIDWRNEQISTQANGGMLIIDWGDQLLYDASGPGHGAGPGVTSVDWNNRILADTTGGTGIDWAKKIASGSWNVDGGLSVSGKPSVTGYQLYDNTATVALNFNDRIAYDSTFTSSVNWNTRKLNNFASNATVDWENLFLSDGSITSVSWGTRVAIDSVGRPSVYWDERNLAGNTWTTVDWLNNYLQIEANGGGSVTVDWGNCLMYDLNGPGHFAGNGFLSLDWQDRLLGDNAGDTVLDWQHQVMTGDWMLNSGRIAPINPSAPTGTNPYFGFNSNFGLGNGLVADGQIYTGNDSNGFSAIVVPIVSGQPYFYFSPSYSNSGTTLLTWGDAEDPTDPFYNFDNYFQGTFQFFYAPSNAAWLYRLDGASGVGSSLGEQIFPAPYNVFANTMVGGTFSGVNVIANYVTSLSNPLVTESQTGQFYPNHGIPSTGVKTPVETQFLSANIYNSTIYPKNYYLDNVHGITSSGTRHLFTTGNGFAGLNFGDNIAFAGTNEQVVVINIIDNNHVKTSTALQFVYNNHTGIAIYPNGVRTVDINGNPAGVTATNDGSPWIIGGNNSAVLGFYARENTEVLDSIWYQYTPGDGSFNVVNFNDVLPGQTVAIRLDPLSGAYYEGIRQFAYGNVKLKYGLSGTDLTFCTVSGNQMTTGGPYYPLNNNISGFITSGQTGSFVTTGQTGSFIVVSPTTVISTGTGISINWSGNNTFQYNITGNTTFTFTGCTNGQTIVVGVYNSGSYTVNFPSGTTGVPNGLTGVKWPAKTTPTQTISGTDVYTFVDLNNTIYGSALQGF